MTDRKTVMCFPEMEGPKIQSHETKSIENQYNEGPILNKISVSLFFFSLLNHIFYLVVMAIIL
jgi:hypothetical protein